MPEGVVVLEYAIRSYAGATGVVIGDKDDPNFKFSWAAPIVDMSTAAGVIVKNGRISITGTILGQGGTLTVDNQGVAFKGTIGNVTIGSQGVCQVLCNHC